MLDDLTQRADKDLRARHAAVLGRLALLLFRHLREVRHDPAAVDALLRSVADLLDHLPDRDRILSFCYILEAGERRPEAVQAALRGIASPKVLEDVMTAADQLRREGEERGLLLGQRRTLLRQLRTRFGQVSSEVEQRILAADEATLDVWTDRVLTASSAHEVVK